MKTPKILVCDEFPQSFLNAIQALGWEVQYLPGQDLEIYQEKIKDCEGLLMNSAIRLTESFLQSANELKLVLRAGVGADHIDEIALQKRGIHFVNTPGANAQAVGEMALGMLLSLLRNIHRADQQVRNFNWIREGNRGVELSSLTIGIIGFGNTGSAFARMLAPSGCRILAYDKYKTGFGSDRVTEATLEEIKEHADVLSFHVPLNEETYHWGNTEFFNSFKKSIYLLNLARGGIIQTTALSDLIDSGKIKGACLDVLETEYFTEINTATFALYSNLFSHSNTVFTPHIGGWTFTSAENIQNHLLSAMAEYISIRKQ